MPIPVLIVTLISHIAHSMYIRDIANNRHVEPGKAIYPDISCCVPRIIFREAPPRYHFKMVVVVQAFVRVVAASEAAAAFVARPVPAVRHPTAAVLLVHAIG